MKRGDHVADPIWDHSVRRVLFCAVIAVFIAVIVVPAYWSMF
jgi:hypothetical protein